jgi:hypothetical protein
MQDAISWASKLQTQVALSTTEAEYIAMSQALHDVIPTMGLKTGNEGARFQGSLYRALSVLQGL